LYLPSFIPSFLLSSLGVEFCNIENIHAMRNSYQLFMQVDIYVHIYVCPLYIIYMYLHIYVCQL
jgi:hypothetical protein